MGVETEDLPRIASQALEDAVTVQQSVVEDADNGLFLGNEAVVNEDHARHGRFLANGTTGRPESRRR